MGGRPGQACTSRGCAACPPTGLTARAAPVSGPPRPLRSSPHPQHGLYSAYARPDIFDLERALEPFVDLILQDLGNPFSFELDLLAKRRLASVLVEMYRQKGTAKGIRNAIRFFLGIELQAISPFASDALTLGESELGIDWVLGPSDRFARYAFNIKVGRILTPTERKQLRAIVEYLKPAHTHFVDLVEPLLPILPDHWALGLSDLGETTDLH